MERQHLIKEIHDLAERIKANSSDTNSLHTDAARLYELVILLKNLPEGRKTAEQWQTPDEVKQTLSSETIVVPVAEKIPSVQATIDLFSVEASSATAPIEIPAPPPAPKKETPRPPSKKKVDLLAGQSGESVAEKLLHKRIADLKAAIGINEKFQFINELFDGNMKEYTVALDQLNSFSSLNEAESYIANLEEVYKWKSDSHITDNFKELVERRFA